MAGDIENPTQDITIYDEAGNPVAVTFSNGKFRLAVDAEVTANVTVEELTGFDNVADASIEFPVAGGIGDTVRVQIVAPDPVDVTSTLTATEAGDHDALAILVAKDLNADTEFKKNWIAKAFCEFVMIIANQAGECGERPAINSLTIAVTGTTTFDLPTNNDKIIRRNKSAEIFANPLDNRIGSLAFRGEVSSVIKAGRPIFIQEFAENTSPTEVQMVVERNTTNMITDPALTIDDVAFLGEFVFNTIGKQVDFIVGSGKEKGSQKTFLATDGGAGRDTYTVGDYVMKDNRGASAPASFASNNGAILVVEAWNGTTWNLLDHSDYDIIDKFQNEADCDILIKPGNIPPAGGDGIRINYAKLVKRFRIRVGIDDSREWTPSVPIKISSGDLIAVNADQISAGGGQAFVNISGFPIDSKTGTI